MYRFSDVTIRKFEFEDIPYKIDWINNSDNNQYLFYDLPLEYDKTVEWFNKNKDNPNRFDAVIEYNGKPVGLVGIINIDYVNQKGENYIVIGDTSYKRKGIATKAGLLNMAYAFYSIGLNKLYGFIEAGNIASIKQCKKRGGHIEGYLRDNNYKNNHFVDTFVVGYFKGMYWED